MRIHRMVFGFRFNKRAYRVGSLSGLIIDEMLSLKENQTKGTLFFSKFEKGYRADEEQILTFLTDDGSRKLTITSSDVVYKKTSSNNQSSVNFDTTLPEISLLWEHLHKIIAFPDVRRIGVVNEYRNAGPSTSNSINLIKALTNFEAPKVSSHFKLEFNKRFSEAKSEKEINVDIDAFEQIIYALYCSEIDETPIEGLVHANIDYQKYYNPCKSKPIDELKRLHPQVTREKEKLIEFLKNKGFV